MQSAKRVNIVGSVKLVNLVYKVRCILNPQELWLFEEYLGEADWSILYHMLRYRESTNKHL